MWVLLKLRSQSSVTSGILVVVVFILSKKYANFTKIVTFNSRQHENLNEMGHGL